jgi:hypothetical protein
MAAFFTAEARSAPHGPLFDRRTQMQERSARTYRRVVLAAALVAIAAAVPARAAEECESLAYKVKAVSLGGTYFPTYSIFNYPADGVGHFDTLMSTTVTVGGGRTPSCLIANFSTMAYPQDNSIVFQVRVDGVPMEGHMNGSGDIATPIVWDPEETDLNNPRMVSYTFFKKVTPGAHKVEVLFAGCCSAAAPTGPAAYAGSPVLTLQHR